MIKPLFAMHATPGSLAAEYVSLRESKKDLESYLSDVDAKIEAVTQLLADAYETAGLTSVKLDSGESVSTQHEPYAQVADREVFRLWCLANGFETQMCLPWQTAYALAKEALLAGRPEPDGLTTFVKTKIILRGAK